MRKPLLVSFIVLSSLALSGQNQPAKIRVKREAVDTLDYRYDITGYFTLRKVIEKGIAISHSCPKDLLIYPIDSNYFRIPRLPQSDRPLGPGDTLINLYWYKIDNQSCVWETCTHSDYWWKFRLNRSSHVIITERVYCSKDKSLLRLMFRIIKLSPAELILEDLQLKGRDRFYYFRRAKHMG